MEIKVLGPDGFNCQKMVEMVKVALKELGIAAAVIKVTDISEIAKHGVLSTPGLVVNGKVKYSGKPMPTMDQIKDLIKGELEAGRGTEAS
jgi:small redox-active disulfide protein 2